MRYVVCIAVYGYLIRNHIVLTKQKYLMVCILHTSLEVNKKNRVCWREVT
jgi:hypothetical protein